MRATAKQRASERALKGKLFTKVAKWREDGYSWNWIARELYFVSNRTIDVAGKTLSEWYSGEVE